MVLNINRRWSLTALSAAKAMTALPVSFAAASPRQLNHAWNQLASSLSEANVLIARTMPLNFAIPSRMPMRRRRICAWHSASATRSYVRNQLLRIGAP